MISNNISAYCPVWQFYCVMSGNTARHLRRWLSPVTCHYGELSVSWSDTFFCRQFIRQFATLVYVVITVITSRIGCPVCLLIIQCDNRVLCVLYRHKSARCLDCIVASESAQFIKWGIASSVSVEKWGLVGFITALRR